MTQRHVLCTSLIATIAGATVVCADARSAPPRDERGVKPLLAIDQNPMISTIGEGRRTSDGGIVERDNDCAAAWAALGPFGGDVADVAVSPTMPSVVLAGIAPSGGSGGRLYRSTDGGATWAAVASVNISVYDIEFTSTGVAYIGTLDGVWRSDNNGVSFSPQNLGIGLNDQVFEVTIDPANEQVIWAGIADALGNQPVNVMRSVNGGASWNNMTPPLASPMNCRGIAIDPTNSQKIYAAFGGSFGGSNFWVTTNGGASWDNRSAGLPNNPLWDVAHDGSRVLVCGGQLFGSQLVGLYTSSNDGVNWTQLSDGTWPSRAVQDIEIEPGNPQRIYVATTSGVFRSDNGGASWTFNIGGSQSFSVNAVTRATGGSTALLIGCNALAVFRSASEGAGFLPSSVGIGQLDVYSIAANPLNPNELAIAFQGLNNGGIYTSLNGGATWTIDTNIPGTRYNTVKFAADGTLYALSDGPSSIAPEGLYRRNLDSSWSSLGPDQGTLFESELFAIAFGRTHPNVILLGGSDFGVAGNEATCWYSDDAGATWTKTYEGPNFEDVNDIEILPGTSDMVALACFTDFGTPQTGGLLRSVTGGQSWTPSGIGLPAAAQCYALAVAADGTTVYLADGRSTGGVHRSNDGGITWIPTGGIGNIQGVECDPFDPLIVYAMQASAPRMRLSKDAGGSFAPFAVGLEAAGFGRGTHVARDGGGVRVFYAGSTGSYASAGCGSGCANPACDRGDVTGDCDVDLEDLAVLLVHFGTPSGATRPMGDLTGDGSVDLTDLAELLTVFGTNCQ